MWISFSTTLKRITVPVLIHQLSLSKEMGCSSSKSVSGSLFVALDHYQSGSKKELNLRPKEQLTILNDQINVRWPRVRMQLKNWCVIIECSIIGPLVVCWKSSNWEERMDTQELRGASSVHFSRTVSIVLIPLFSNMISSSELWGTIAWHHKRRVVRRSMPFSKVTNRCHHGSRFQDSKIDFYLRHMISGESIGFVTGKWYLYLPHMDYEESIGLVSRKMKKKLLLIFTF
jgi:hypothetical protein